MQAAIHIGTSGWHYAHWSGVFYPEDLPKSEYLSYYAARFQTVEINNSFYRLPETKTFETWRETVPDSFLFAVKANRYITHMKKLKDPQEPLENFFSRLEGLGDKIGPILFQLPPRWRLNLERLQFFLASLPEGYRYAFEFRDPSWFDPGVYAALSARNASFCIYEINRRLSPKQVTADFVYLRLHGPDGAYQGSYSDETLREWAADFTRWSKSGQVDTIYCYFDNDQQAFAVQNAARLIEIVRR